MAMQGYPVSLIAETLQHDQESSAYYCMDAVGQEFLPIFERLDQNLGGRFSGLRQAWFKGEIVERDSDASKPIFVPSLETPAAVGACSKEEMCGRHPLFSCYSCEHFLAYRDGNHEAVLKFIEEEFSRWRSSEFSSSSSKVVKDFDRIAVGVREVPEEIEGKRNAEE
jgi:hypothetical protein